MIKRRDVNDRARYHILARFLLRDHEKQCHTAVSLLQQDRIYTAPPSVMLELVLVWVLQVNDCTRAEIVKGLRALFGLPNFKPMALDEIDRALRLVRCGNGFRRRRALALSAKADGFVTFDRALAKQAVKSGTFPPVAVHRGLVARPLTSPGLGALLRPRRSHRGRLRV